MSVSVPLSDGETVIVWQRADDVLFQLFDSTFNPIGPVGTITTGPTVWISATALEEGSFSVIWDTTANSAPMAQDYDAQGEPLGALYSLPNPPAAGTAFTNLANDETVAGDGTSSTTLELADGGSVIAHFGPTDSLYAETIQRFDTAGNAIGAAFVRDAGATTAFIDNQITPLVNGGYAVSYIAQSSWTSVLTIESFAADGGHVATLTPAELDFTGNFTYFPEIFAQTITGLPDGGFVVSWIAQDNAPAEVYTEEFTASDTAIGPPIFLGSASMPAGDSDYPAPTIDVFADGRYMVSWLAPEGTQSAQFQEQAAPLTTARNDVIETPATNYVAPVGPHDVLLTGDTPQTVQGNDLGDTIIANDYASTLIGGAGSDTLIAGHNADVMTGGGSNDIFAFPYLPWNAGQITDFVLGSDKIDISAILTAIGYTGTDPVADGYVSFRSDGLGDTDIYVNSHDPADPWPTLITTLDGVSSTGLTAANVFGDASTSDSSGGSGEAPGAAQTAAASYTVPAGVTSVQLIGTASQTIIANNLGDTITSNDYASTLIGGTGNDTLIAGHGADTLTGGGGKDSFVFNYLPWNAGHITDFDTAHDTVNLSGIFKSIGYSGSNPTADGYLNFISNGSGDTKVYVNPDGPTTAIPILVTTIDHVAPDALHQGDWIYS